MKQALHAMRRRGPNHHDFKRHQVAAATVMLGHARLSVIDLTSNANQPMYSMSQRYGLVFNGEIYNYLELRAELAQVGRTFHSESDTEVLLAAWEAWGTEAIRRLKGMFAFAVIDFERQTCTLVRDAFGIKPLYYASWEGAFCFASEVTALRAFQSGKAKLNWQRAYDYLVHGEYDFGEETFFAGVKSLRPGHLLVIDVAKPHEAEDFEWWRPSVSAAQSISLTDATEQLRARIIDNVRLHLRSDVALGAALSGGLDSSTIVCAMRYLEPEAPIHTFSFVAAGSAVSEESWIDRVNHHVGANPHKVVVSHSEFASDIEDLILTQGEPFGSTSIYAQYRVYKLAREHGVTVTLDGQGADEVLGGYNGYPGQRIRSLLDRGQFGTAWSFLSAWASWPGRSRVEGLKRVVGGYSDGWIRDTLRSLNGMSNAPEWINSGPLRETGVHLGYPASSHAEQMPSRRMIVALATSLSDRGLLSLLRHGDRNSMRFSVESRVPFLTTDLVDFALSMPEDYLVSLGGETKSLMRSAMRGIVPDDVLDRRDKIGFATPEQTWLLDEPEMARQWLADDLNLPFLDQTKLREHFEQVVRGQRPFSWQVWRWINFTLWYRSLA